MCTLTLIPWSPPHGGSGTRVVCNRDESRLRPVARPPDRRDLGRHTALMPVDPASDGTWIAASDAGLVAVLMNVYLAGGSIASIGGRTTVPPVSRGTIIPRVLEADDLEKAIREAERLDPRQFEPFRLVVADRARMCTFEWSRGSFLGSGIVPIDRPMFFTSSGIGDTVVRAPRERLFAELFASTADHGWPQRQDEFHRHIWLDDGRASVWMTRDEAMTVSRTEVELSADRVTIRYHARIGDTLETAPVVEHSLSVAAASHPSADTPIRA